MNPTRTFLQGAATLGLFLVLWYGFSQLDFVSFFHVKNLRDSTERQLGDLVWTQVESTEDIIYDDSLNQTLERLLDPICKKAGIPRDSLKVHLIRSDEVNAFALPDRHLAVYSGLITDCPKQEALQGVLAHEVAHIQKNHVMQKLSKEIGLSALLSIVSGGRASQVHGLIRLLSSSAYDRSLEEEADYTGVSYLMDARIDPKPLADFFFQLASKRDLPEAMNWISTHPDSEERARVILKRVKGRATGKAQTLTAAEWSAFKERIEGQ